MRYGLEDVAVVEDTNFVGRGLGTRGIPAGDFAEQDVWQESTREPASREGLQVYLSNLFDVNNERCRGLLKSLGLSALLLGTGALIGIAADDSLKYLTIPVDAAGLAAFVNHFRFY